MTRLRFTLKDNAEANEAVLKDSDGIIAVVDAGSQYQIVIGNQVADVYQAIVEAYQQINGSETSQEANAEKETNKDNDEQTKSWFSKLLDFISGVFHPAISIISTAGIIKGLLAIWLFVDPEAASLGAFQLWNAFGDGIFYFLPVILGLTTANKIGGSPFIGLGVGLALTYPNIAAMATADAMGTVFAGTPFAMGYSTTFFNIPIIMPSSAGYATSVLPAMIATIVAVNLHKRIEKRLPDVVKGIIASALGNLMGLVFSLIQDIPVVGPTLSGILLGGFIQIFVVAGVHWGFTPIIFGNLSRLGYDAFYSPYFAASFAQTMVVLAIILKTKDQKLKNIAIPAFISGIFGITEPAIYGVTLARKKMFAISCIAAAIGGGIIGYGQAKLYQYGGFGIFGFASYIGTDGFRDLTWILLGVGVAMVIAFVMAFYTYKDEEQLDR